jgi:phosphonate metabolism protein PhnN/1,5-bisphosphokinase (PRPP-forming)
MLLLVVGPSGAGKDALLNRARVILAEDPRFVFARRAITRGPDPAGENHEPVDESAFARRLALGEFALWWRAHGLGYAIPRAALADAHRDDRAVVANVSRGVLAGAARRYPSCVIEVTAPHALLAARLEARGREDAEDVARRLARDLPIPPDLPRETVVNDATLEEGVARFVAALSRAAAGARR